MRNITVIKGLAGGLLAVLLILGGLWASQAWAQPYMGYPAILVRVRDDDHMAIRGVPVTVALRERPNTPEEHNPYGLRQGYTDNAGEFRGLNMIGGVYDVLADVNGTRLSRVAVIPPGSRSTTVVELTLRR
jgi:hypothetical protein